MLIQMKEQVPEVTMKDVFSIVVTTMEGDADDYHTIHLLCNTEEELKQRVIQLQILLSVYPRGKSGDDNYNHVDFFYRDFMYDWHHDSNCGFQDSIDSYDITYYDEEGTPFDVLVELSEESNHYVAHYLKNNPFDPEEEENEDDE